MHVWYAGYGSNLFRDRFLCYIKGGKFQWSGNRTKGCNDKTTPASRAIMIPYELYFAKNSDSWEGGVAFISTTKDEDKQTYGRMWKVTTDQFLEIWEQEGSGWYNVALHLGKDENGVPIITITNNHKLTTQKPSPNYVKTIIAGLKETYKLSDKTICDYLISKDGINGNFKEQDIMAICRTV